MGEMITAAETAVWLKARDNYLILTHRRPDGDTLGSAGALAQGLRDAGKTAYVLANPETTPRYARFVDEYIAPDGFRPDFIVAVDTASAEMFPKNGLDYKDSVALCIDHHPSNTRYADKICLDQASASCGELVYDILMTMSGGVCAKGAECLYAALSTDTGCFAFANTTANTLRVAASLIESGAPHSALNRLLFRNKTHGRICIEGMIFSGLEFFFDEAVTIIILTRDMIESVNASEDDMDDIASLPSSIDGVLVGITIRELTSAADCKVSVRTTGVVDANAICAVFGGGGHPMAAGFTMGKTAAEIKKELLEVLGGFLP